MLEFYAYVWRSSASRQIILIVLTIIAALMAMMPLELQRQIINTLAGREKAERLTWLCGAYLIAALSISDLKYLLNIKSAGLGESVGCHQVSEQELRKYASVLTGTPFIVPQDLACWRPARAAMRQLHQLFRAAIRTAEAKFADAGGLATRIQLLRTTQHRAARRIVVSSSQLPLPAAESYALRRRITEMIEGLLAATGLAGLVACFVVQGAIAAPIAPTAVEITAPQGRSLDRVYYYNGRHYAYHYNNRYYAHRVYRHGHWHYY